MCVTLPATVVSVEGDAAVVDVDGHRLTASTRTCRDVAPGESVLVGLGVILARLDPTEADRMAADLASVSGASRPSPTGGGRR